MNRKKIFQFNTELYKVTGIQKVLLDIHEALKEECESKIVGSMPFEKVNPSLQIKAKDYIRFKNPFIFRNSIVIIHERRLLPLMKALSLIPGLHMKCIYVHHNELYGKKCLSLFPKHIVAISDSGINNLINHFGVPISRITKIHNCVRETDKPQGRLKAFDSNKISILYPARINSVKRQIDIVKHLEGKLDSRVRILFAGVGPQYEEFRLMWENNPQFKILGFIADIPTLMREVDFVSLFSIHEGLPISLIEAAQNGVPVICNDVGGNTEIVKSGKNGFIVNDWDTFIEVLNSLPKMTQKDIDKMSFEARKVYENSFTFQKFKARYIGLIKSV